MKTLLAVIILIKLFDYGEAIMCVQCASCVEPYNNATNPITNCSLSSFDSCLKTTIRYPGGYFISKSCITSSQCLEKSFGLGNYGFWINCCTKDGCNAAEYLKPKNMPLVIALLASITGFIRCL